MESVWIDTNVTALYTYHLYEIPKSKLIDAKLEKNRKENLSVLLAGIGSWLEVYLPFSKVNREQTLSWPHLIPQARNNISLYSLYMHRSIYIYC